MLVRAGHPRAYVGGHREGLSIQDAVVLSILDQMVHEVTNLGGNVDEMDEFCTRGVSKCHEIPVRQQAAGLGRTSTPNPMRQVPPSDTTVSPRRKEPSILSLQTYPSTPKDIPDALRGEPGEVYRASCSSRLPHFASVTPEATFSTRSLFAEQRPVDLRDFKLPNGVNDRGRSQYLSEDLGGAQTSLLL